MMQLFHCQVIHNSTMLKAKFVCNKDGKVPLLWQEISIQYITWADTDTIYGGVTWRLKIILYYLLNPNSCISIGKYLAEPRN